MAITTLPYPNMDFVPLDILTATELDQLVANIEAINNSNITATAIANGAVMASKFGSDVTAVKRTELFSGDSSGNVTLSQSVANFDQIEITFKDTNNPPNQLVRTIPADAGAVVLDIPHPGGSSTLYWNISRWTISGTTFTKSSNSYQKTIASTSVTTTAGSYIHITKVVGIKFTQN